jgi:polar amino acid transport system permease protein
MRARAVAALAAALLLAGCTRVEYTWAWHIVSPTTAAGRTNLWYLTQGLGLTIELSVVSIVVSMGLGLVVALAGFSKNRALLTGHRCYIEALRNVPVFVLLLWTYYALPVVLGLAFTPFAGAVLAIAMSDSAFEAEIFRAGIQSVDRGHVEAARSLGMSARKTMRRIILPQAIRRMLPAMGNQFIYIVKSSALASVIGLAELTRKANELTTTLYRPFEIYSLLAVEYLCVLLVLSQAVRWVERRVAIGR